jgi:sulfide:quinone oxidoreductase
MEYKQLAPGIHVSGQIGLDALEEIARQGFRAIICNRPDGEDPSQPTSSAVEEKAARLGIGFAYVPVTPEGPDDRDVADMARALERLPRPLLAYCRSGARSAKVWERAVSSVHSPAGGKVRDVVIVGGGSAGIATAASLLKRGADLDIALVEPSDVHYYQPGWTLVGAGVFRPETTRRPMASVMPRGVDWIRQAAVSFATDDNLVHLADGTSIAYRMLVAAPGIKLDWEAIPGLAETLGRNGVTSNYRYDLAQYTDKLVSELKGGSAIFTQPPMPIKCAGAPQKAMYLSCDRWMQDGRLGNIKVEFHTAGAVLFGVAAYVPALMAYVDRYDIHLNIQSNLVAVDGERRVATFQHQVGDGQTERVEKPFDLLHAVPPQTAPDFVRTSPLAAPNGFIDVDEATLRHPRYPNVFALGDCCAASNAKTAAAARKQAPVVAENVLSVMEGREPVAVYDGYGSCPLTVERGRIVLAEFGYGGKLLPTFPTWMLDGTKATRAAWFLKDRLLPPFYWHGMLKGREWMAEPVHRPGVRA